jgi:hypothetical protein
MKVYASDISFLRSLQKDEAALKARIKDGEAGLEEQLLDVQAEIADLAAEEEDDGGDD